MEGGHGVEGVGQGGDALGEEGVGGLVIRVGMAEGDGRPQLQGTAEEVAIIQLQSGGDVTGTLHAAEQSLHLGGVGLHQQIGGMGAAALDVEVAALQMGARHVGERPLGDGGLGAEGIDGVNGGLQLGQGSGGQGGQDGGHAAVQVGLGHDPHLRHVGGAEISTGAAVGVDVHQTGDDAAATGIVHGNTRGRGGVGGVQGGDAAVLHQERAVGKAAGCGMVKLRVADKAGVGIHKALLSGTGHTTAFCILYIIADSSIFCNRFSQKKQPRRTFLPSARPFGGMILIQKPRPPYGRTRSWIQIRA